MFEEHFWRDSMQYQVHLKMYPTLVAKKSQTTLARQNTWSLWQKYCLEKKYPPFPQAAKKNQASLARQNARHRAQAERCPKCAPEDRSRFLWPGVVISNYGGGGSRHCCNSNWKVERLSHPPPPPEQHHI